MTTTHAERLLRLSAAAHAATFFLACHVRDDEVSDIISGYELDTRAACLRAAHPTIIVAAALAARAERMDT